MTRPFFVKFARATASGLVGGLGWLVGMMIAFAPAQAILTDPALQSAKFLLAVGPQDPAPRIVAAPWILPVGVIAISIVYGWTYAALLPALRGAWWKRGMKFGLAAFALMALWFEFFLPWNVMLEPAPLVALELVCWAITLQCAGLTIAGVHAWLGRKDL